MKLRIVIWGALLTLTGTGVAGAQGEEESAEDGAEVDATAQSSDDALEDVDDDLQEGDDSTAAAKPKKRADASVGTGTLSSEDGGDGGRFRFGVALGLGPLST